MSREPSRKSKSPGDDEEPAWSIPSLREPRYSQSLERGLAILGLPPRRRVEPIAASVRDATMPQEDLNERGLPVALDSGTFSIPNPASLSNIRTFVDALRTATRGSDIPASDEGIRTILERTCGQFKLRIEPQETIGLIGPTGRHRVKRAFLLHAGFHASAIGLLFLDPPAEWSLLLPDDGAPPAPAPGGQGFPSSLLRRGDRPSA